MRVRIGVHECYGRPVRRSIRRHHTNLFPVGVRVGHALRHAVRLAVKALHLAHGVVTGLRLRSSLPLAAVDGGTSEASGAAVADAEERTPRGKGPTGTTCLAGGEMPSGTALLSAEAVSPLPPCIVTGFLPMGLNPHSGKKMGAPFYWYSRFAAI